MLENFKKLYLLVRRGDRTRVGLLVVLMIVTAFAQTAGIASIMPFLTVLADPAVIERNQWLNGIYTVLGFSSTDAFLHFLGIASFIVFVTGTTLQALTQWLVTRFSSMQQYHLSHRLMSDYLYRPYVFFLRRNSGDLAKTVLQETGQAISGALLPAMRLISYTLLACSIVFLLIFIEPLLALSVAIGLGSLYGLIYMFARSWLTRIGKDRVAANRERFTTASEAFTGAKEIRLLGREKDYLERFRKPSLRYARNQANATLLQNLPQYAIEGIAFGGVLLIVVVLMADGGIATALPLIGLYGLAGKQLIPAFQKIFGTIAAIRFNMPAVDNVLEDLGPTPTNQDAEAIGSNIRPLIPSRSIAIRGLTFRYPESDRVALESIDLFIPVRTTIGLVGSSGAGKSTLVDIILGLLEPQQGLLVVDDETINQENMRSWQASLGYVPQHIFLADQSVAANIALGVPPDQIDRSAVERAARMANLHDFVMNELDSGYDTEIGERGVRLSGGQRQRIGIARALYRDPAVLIFDEATSALDNSTERAVMEAIHNLSGKKTVILIAHRLSTVQPCSKIHVLEHGRIVDEGSWDELTAHSIPFKRLAGATCE